MIKNFTSSHPRGVCLFFLRGLPLFFLLIPLCNFLFCDSLLRCSHLGGVSNRSLQRRLLSFTATPSLLSCFIAFFSLVNSHRAQAYASDATEQHCRRRGFGASRKQQVELGWLGGGGQSREASSIQAGIKNSILAWHFFEPTSFSFFACLLLMVVCFVYATTFALCPLYALFVRGEKWAS
ncbi:hypothetical protein IWX90DRAFT_139088 [Phyllosticta citrichinensis]|uniref:Transmembrane protein n=1 Tax=Phyllosticta citrichinensis TaxID=1130410 RepID=A0ABR1XYV4_9PEZI